MADTKKYLHNVNVVNNKVMNLLLNPLTTVQRTTIGGTLTLSEEGYVCYDLDLNQQYFWDGTQWIVVGGGSIGPGTTNYVPKWDGSGTNLVDSQIFDDGIYVRVGNGGGNMAFPYETLILEANKDMKFGTYTSVGSFASGGASYVLGYTNITSASGYYPGFEFQMSGATLDANNLIRYNFIQRDITGSVVGSNPNIFNLYADSRASFKALIGTGTEMVVADASGFISRQPIPTGNITGSGTVDYIVKWTPTGTALGDSSIQDSAIGIVATNSITAASGVAKSVNLTSTLTAAANNDLLSALDINTTFTGGAFTGLTKRLFRATANSVLRTELRDSGIQSWYLNDGSSEVGLLGFSTPNAHPGIVMFNASLTGRSDIRHMTNGGFTIASHAAGTIPLVDQFYFNASGNFGIGTATDTYKLDVNGEINTNVGIRLGTNGAQTGIYGGANIFNFWAGNSNIATWGLAAAGGTYYDHFASPVYTNVSSGTTSIFKIRGSVTSTSANSAAATQLDISPIYTQQTFGTGTLRGVYYHPQLNSLNGSTHIAWENTSGDIIHGNLATGGADEMVTVDTNGKLKKQTIPSGSTSPLTTKGDIYTYSTTNARLPVGLDTQVLIADSSTATGLKWGSNTAPTPLGYYGQYFSYVSQSAITNNVGQPMAFETLDLSDGITVVSDGTALTRITFANSGKYNLQFSTQFKNIDNSEQDVYIWLRKLGTDVIGSTGLISIPKTHGGGAGTPGHNVVSWNFLLDVIGGEYYQLIWATSDVTKVSIAFLASTVDHPSTASTLFTVTQQAGIMAGTGITRGVYSVSTNTAALAGANVDYVYLVSGTTTITLPTAVGNTNRYTIKNTGTNTVSIATTSSQTIDGSSSPITINVQYVSLDLISDGSNWNII